MSSRFSSEVKSYMEKADQAVAAAEKLILDGYYDFAASRAYYAAFYPKVGAPVKPAGSSEWKFHTMKI